MKHNIKPNKYILGIVLALCVMLNGINAINVYADDNILESDAILISDVAIDDVEEVVEYIYATTDEIADDDHTEEDLTIEETEEVTSEDGLSVTTAALLKALLIVCIPLSLGLIAYIVTAKKEKPEKRVQSDEEKAANMLVSQIKELNQEVAELQTQKAHLEWQIKKYSNNEAVDLKRQLAFYMHEYESKDKLGSKEFITNIIRMLPSPNHTRIVNELSVHKIRLVEVKTGDKYDSVFHEMIQSVSTNKPKLNGTIAEFASYGAVFPDNTILKARVSVYVLNN
ncbi:MAG: hypothetical protein R3Y32_00140 [Bacillota bacterium]